MATKKNIYKRQMQKKRMEILEAVIEEEIDSVISELILLHEEEEGDNYPSAPTSGFGRGGGAVGSGAEGGPVGTNSFIGAFGGNALRAAFAAGKQMIASLITQFFSLAGTLIGGSVAALIPFNDPEAVTYIAKKMQAFENKNIEAIEKYYENDMKGIEAGWNLIKGDYMGIGFIIDPFGLVSTAITANKGVDAAASIMNTITAGKTTGAMEKILDFFHLNKIENPGSYRSYVQNKEYDRQRAAADDKYSPFSLKKAMNKIKGEKDSPEDSTSTIEKIARDFSQLNSIQQQQFLRNLPTDKVESFKKLLHIMESINKNFGPVLLEKKKVQYFSQFPKELMAVLQGQGPNKLSKKSVGEILLELDGITGSRQETIKLIRPVLDTSLKNNKSDFNRAANDMTAKFYSGLFGPEVISEINKNISDIDEAKLNKLKNNKNISRMIKESIKQLSSENPKFPISPDAIQSISPAINQAATVISSNMAQIAPAPAAPPAAVAPAAANVARR